MKDDKSIEESVTGTTPSNGTRNDYDLLAYFADFTNGYGNLVQNVEQRLLLSIFVDNAKQNFPIQSNSGATSQVFVMKSAHFLEPAFGTSTANPLPELIAVKRRTFKGSRHAIKDWRPLKTLSTELRILTDPTIREHPNIVNFLGNCWEYADELHTLILPMMIFEATTLGDLQTYHNQHPDLTLGRQLQLGLGVTRGVAGLHEAGIIHCDIKPKNVLVFRQDDTVCPVIPKLIDFDLAILHQDCLDRVLPPQGTKAWNSPEQTDDRAALAKDDLFKIDIFALAMVLLNLLTSNFLSGYISAFENPAFERFNGGLTVEQFKRTGSLAVNVSSFLKDFANISGPEGSNHEFSSFRVLWMRATKILTRALDGNLRHRSSSAVEIEHELQRLLEDIIDAELLDYHNKEVVLSSERSGKMSILLNTVPEEERKNIDEALAFCDAFLTACQPRAVELAETLGISVEQISDTILHSGGASQFGFLLDETPQEELQRIPGRKLQDRKADVVKISHNLGTFSSFPLALSMGIMTYLKDVYSSPRQPNARRAEAAFEHAIASVALCISEGPDAEDSVDESLKMLRFAAENGHTNAQYLVGWMESTLRPSGSREAISLVECGWLKKGILEGSRISRRQLQQYDQVAYSEALQQIRTESRGMGGTSWINPKLRVYERFGARSIWHNASAGNLNKLQHILLHMEEIDESRLRDFIDVTIYGDKATPLIEACRSGHTEVVHLLLEYGADASLRDYDGVGPLHFLSSFESSEMLPIATTLINHGCELEGWTSGVSYSDTGGAGLDCVYGLADGTPLLWAVAADCIEAVEVLLGLGADPFARQRPDFLDSKKGDYFYPVLWAARAHQCEILERLLQDVPQEHVVKSLQTCWIVTQKGLGQVGPLGYACLYGGGHVLARMLLHGPKHIEQCSKTIRILLDSGASPDRVADCAENEYQPQIHEHYSALDMASQFGQPYAMHTLLQWKDGILQPKIREWCTLLITTANHGNRACFTELMKMKIQPEGAFTWPVIITEIGKRTQEMHCLNAVISKHQDADPTPADYTLPFAIALQEGCLESARIIYERAGRVDAAYVYEAPGADKKYSILGNLLFRAKRHPTRVPAVKAFLDIVGARDDVFEKVIAWGEDDQGLNALQFAIFYAFDSPHISTGTDLLAVLLRKFHHPIKHLACRQGSLNNSLLHLAVQTGNHAALDVLLNVNGMGFDLCNSKDMTAFDVCLTRWQDSSRDTNRDVLDSISAEKGKEWAHEQWELATNRMMKSMEKKGASKYGKFSHVFKRLSPSEELCIKVSPEGEITRLVFNPIEFRAYFSGMEYNQELAEGVANLAVGRCFYLKMKAAS